MEKYNAIGQELEKRMKLWTHPLAIKLLEKESDIPEEAVRPRRDLGGHLGLCQGFAMSRREGATVAMLKEDNWCYAPVLALGMAETPDYVLEGKIDFPGRILSEAAAKELAKNSPKLELGKYIGTVSAPLNTCTYEPDFVITYCNSAQLRSLLSGLRYRNGYRVTTTLDPGGACIHSSVPVIQSHEATVTVPCLGDRRFAMAQDEEMIFSVHRDMLDDLMEGLRHFDEIGLGLPTRFIYRPDYPSAEGYMIVGREIGLEMPE